MERGWLETIHMLGLDLQIAAVMVLLLLERLVAFIGWIIRAAQSRAAAPARRPATTLAEPATGAWPPREWRPSH